MPEIKNYTFSHTELASILLRDQGIHEGLWGLYIEFNMIAANVPSGPGLSTFLPACINFVSKIGIQRFDAPSNLTVDAAEVNPRPGDDNQRTSERKPLTPSPARHHPSVKR